ncbi:MAG: cytochrome c oxidase subunit II, partial [Ignavibacteria bacterium]|nr:cytochrome c oxidase subunit II [Ignavibacteria bacterium]
MFTTSNYIETVDNAFIFIVVISALLLIAITTIMLYFVYKYNRKKGAKAQNIHGNTSLEIAWTVIPVILVLGMFYFGWVGYEQLSNPPADSMVVQAQAQMWKWTFIYDNGVKSDTMYVPIGKPVRVNLNSQDVDHAFYVPAFRLKRDAIPNKKNFVWFSAQKLGKFDIACAEYC